MRILLVVPLLAGLSLGACGYKGALYLPDASAPARKAAVPFKKTAAPANATLSASSPARAPVPAAASEVR
jgi:predicted small lipoprotein YifL